MCSEIETIPLADVDVLILRRPDHDHMDVDDDCTNDNAITPPDWLHPGVLEPKMPYEDGVLWDILVDPQGVISSSDGSTKLLLCKDCLKDLKVCKLPRLALANRLFLGDIPEELKGLGMVEESIIGLCRAKCIIIHLKGDKCDELDTRPTETILPNHQRGMRGHVIVHAQRPDVVAELFPPSIGDIVAPICIIYSGSNHPTVEWLKNKAKPLAVRADRIRKALKWLKAPVTVASHLVPHSHVCFHTTKAATTTVWTAKFTFY